MTKEEKFRGTIYSIIFETITQRDLRHAFLLWLHDGAKECIGIMPKDDEKAWNEFLGYIKQRNDDKEEY